MDKKLAEILIWLLRKKSDLRNSVIRAGILTVTFLFILTSLKYLYFFLMERFPDGRIFNDEGKSFISLLLAVVTTIALFWSLRCRMWLDVDDRQSVVIFDNLIGLLLPPNEKEAAYYSKGTGKHIILFWEKPGNKINLVREAIKTPPEFGILTKDGVPVGIDANILYAVDDPVKYSMNNPSAVDGFFRDFMVAFLETEYKKLKTDKIQEETQGVIKELTSEINKKLEAEDRFGVSLSSFSIGQYKFPPEWERASATGMTIKQVDKAAASMIKRGINKTAAIISAVQIVTGTGGGTNDIIAATLLGKNTPQNNQANNNSGQRRKKNKKGGKKTP